MPRIVVKPSYPSLSSYFRPHKFFWLEETPSELQIHADQLLICYTQMQREIKTESWVGYLKS